MMKSNAVVVEKNLTRDEDMTLRNRTLIRKDMTFQVDTKLQNAKLSYKHT